IPAPVLFLLFMGTQERYFGRWLLPIFPIVCILAAYAAGALVHRLRAWRTALALPAALGLSVVLLAEPLWTSIRNDRVLARADTRNLARAWFVEHVPQGSK